MCEFKGNPDTFYLCSVCLKNYNALPEKDRWDLDLIPLETFSLKGKSVNVFDEINEELNKMEPSKFMPLIADHTARTMSFPVSINEAMAMQQKHRSDQNKPLS